nr:clathrin light chain-like isoform X3 [Penaeus vannamei]
MDGFGDSFVPPAEGAPASEVDPAAEFLAREQDQLAGLDDDLVPPATQSEQPAAPVGLDGDADLFGGVPVNGAPDLESFEMLGRDEVAQARSPVPPVIREEPEKIKLWREQQRLRLEEKDAAENKNKEELKEKARKELEDWYKQHEEQVAKTRQANRSAEKELVAETGKMEPGTEWERITKLCDFNPKTSSRPRHLPHPSSKAEPTH